MKTDNQTIDKLMRRHAALSIDTRPSSEANSFASAPPSAHLDADELSAFAENALPAATRTRYVAHLADCASCRKIVVDIVGAAANVASQITPKLAHAEINPASRWRQFFNSLFGSQTLRYAMPALAFLVIGGIVWRAYESPRTDTARREIQDQPSAVSSAPNQRRTENANASASPAANASSSSPPAQPQRREVSTKDKAAANAAESTPRGESASRSSDVSAEAAKAAPAPPTTQNEDQNNYAQQQTDNLGQQVFEPERDAEEQKSSTAKKEKNKDEQRADESATGEQVNVSDEAQVASEQTAAPEQSASEPRRGARSALQSARRREASPPASRAKTERNQATGGGAVAADDAQPAGPLRETQTVGGRSFRRAGNSWIDTAYRSAQAIVNVARDSEQYRALVADEPALRSIAERLSGEVIVVWKDRAYRFR
ncbi:MAG: zf-HC2 domain-containing protein [Pyrinomonadaceae bacterium]